MRGYKLIFLITILLSTTSAQLQTYIHLDQAYESNPFRYPDPQEAGHPSLKLRYSIVYLQSLSAIPAVIHSFLISLNVITFGTRLLFLAPGKILVQEFILTSDLINQITLSIIITPLTVISTILSHSVR